MGKFINIKVLLNSMPRKLTVQIINSKKFKFENIIFHDAKGYNSIIRIPNSIGKEHAGKKVKVTLEIIE